jgi:hypothetical protein
VIVDGANVERKKIQMQKKVFQMQKKELEMIFSHCFELSVTWIFPFDFRVIA